MATAPPTALSYDNILGSRIMPRCFRGLSRREAVELEDGVGLALVRGAVRLYFGRVHLQLICEGREVGVEMEACCC